ncbi:barstar family protein [Saccharothrix sp. Mg75]|uniref:barstar family protein n=1 Tax=Saccharothrix sp. Mg75 TaxID=3445357 RepID=UPI003EE8FEF1
MTVLAQRPSTTVPGTVDVDLDGFVRVHDRTDEVPRPDHVDEFALRDRDEAAYGTCRDITGVFREQAEPPVPRVRLLGCRPEAPLPTALDAVGQSTKAASRRRRLRFRLHAVADDGSTGLVTGAGVSATVEATEPSRLGVGLLDLTVVKDWGEPLPAGIPDILGHWRAGRPSRRDLWAGYGRELRHRWSAVALGHRTDAPNRPPGATYELHGRFVTDIEGFYYATGEAVNGPGGYFGFNLDALEDCLRGRFGTQTPFRLVWHDSAVAHEHLAGGYDRRRLRPTVTMRYLRDVLAEHDVEVDLR